MIINENTPGLKEENGNFIFEGDLICDSLHIEIGLLVTGCIKANKYIKE